MDTPKRMKFGSFLGPFHRVGENPTLAMDRDLELIDWMDSLGIRAGLSSSVPELAMWLPGRLRVRFRDRAVAGAGAQLGRMLAEPRWTRSADDRLVRAQDRILEEADRLLRERAEAGQ